MNSFHHGCRISSLLLGTLAVAGCGVQGNVPIGPSTQPDAPVNKAAVAHRQPAVRIESPQSALRVTVQPTEIMGLAGSLYSRQSWPLLGLHPQNTGTPISSGRFAKTGAVIGGVLWRWPAKDRNPAHYIVVPTTIGGKPYVAWAHLGPVKYLGKPLNGSAGYAPNQIEPTAPSTLWLTPWNPKGGLLDAHAKLVTDDIPPIFASKSYVFPSNPKDTSVKSLASTAWTGWFQWGHVKKPFTLKNPSKYSTAVAMPDALFPAYNGVVLSIRSQVLYANQGEATNLIYLDLAKHQIYGLASLTDGGGLFSAMRVVSGMVLTGEATDLTKSGNTLAKAFVFNEATRQRVAVPSSAVMANSFQNWTMKGSRIYDQNQKLVAALKMLASAIEEPSAKTFGVSQ